MEGKKIVGKAAAEKNDATILRALRHGPKTNAQLVSLGMSVSTVKRRTKVLSEKRPPRIRKTGDGKWERMPEDILKQEKKEAEEWRNRTLDIGGTAYPSIVQHVHHVCIGLIYIAREHGVDVTSLIPDAHLHQMGITLSPDEEEKVGPFIDNGREHLREAYFDAHHALSTLDVMRTRFNEGRERLKEDAIDMVKAKLTLDDLASPDMYTPSPEYPRSQEEIEEFKESFFYRLANEVLIPEARRKMTGQKSVLINIYRSNGSLFLVPPRWGYLCPEEKENIVVGFIHSTKERLIGRLGKLDELEADIEEAAEELACSIADIVNRIMENNRLGGSCPSCPVPPVSEL